MSLSNFARPLAQQLRQASIPASQQMRGFAKVPTAKGSQLESMPDPVKNFWEAPSTPYMWKHSHADHRCKNDKISTVGDGTTPESAMSRGGLQTKQSVAPAEGSKAGGGAAAALLAVQESSNEHHLLQMMQQPNRYEGAGTRAKAHLPEQADKSAKKTSKQAVKEKAGPSAAGKMGFKASSLSAHQPNVQASKGGRPRKEATKAARTRQQTGKSGARKKAVIDESDTDPGNVDDPESYSSQDE
ncbi:TPA: hypothetical protein ACH3X1_005969 [Trebouxia sp. C0004]